MLYIIEHGDPIFYFILLFFFGGGRGDITANWAAFLLHIPSVSMETPLINVTQERFFSGGHFQIIPGSDRRARRSI